jgi:hypothetical protein
MGAGYLKALPVIAAAVLAVGCGGAPPPPAHRGTPAPVRQDSPAPALSKLTDVEACLQLRGSLSRNQGAPDIPTLRIIADHVTEPRMAAEARNAVRDIDHTGVAAIPIALLRDRCARAGVQIRGR